MEMTGGGARHPGLDVRPDSWAEDVAAGVAWATQRGAAEADHQHANRGRTRLSVMLDRAGHPLGLWS